MHENREISCTPWSKDEGRSAKAIEPNGGHERTGEVGLCRSTREPAEQRRAGGLRRRPGREGHRLRRTSFYPTCVRHRAGSACPRDCAVCGKQCVSPPFLHGKSRMRKRARTDLRGLCLESSWSSVA